MKKESTILLFFWTMTLISCGNYYEDKTNKTITEPAPAPLNAKATDFELVRTNIIEPRCKQCHMEYVSYENVKSDLIEIQESILSNRMPKKGGPLSDSQKNIMIEWIQNGAPEFTSDTL